MTRRLGKGNSERGRARLALVTVILLCMGILLGVSPGGSLTSVMAAVSGSPTSTTTDTTAPPDPGTPAPSAGSHIQLVNPSKYSATEVVSHKSDANTTYHLVAWVSNIGAVTDPFVEFEVRTTGMNAQTLFSAQGVRIGTSDTFEATWPAPPDPNIPDGDYTVHAILFTGNTQISTDSEPVTVRQSAETADISYPVAGGTLGVYDPPGDAPAGFVTDVTVSETARNVLVLYGTAPPGTEQNWRRCQSQLTVFYSNGKDRRIGCTIATSVAPEHITGVAAVAGGRVDFIDVPPSCMNPNPGNPPTCNTTDSGDAHRVTGYAQVPASLGIQPSSSSPVISNCHELTASVLDSQSRAIWRAPIDLHATGPSDNLQFGRTARTSAYQPPDQAGTHDANEPTFNCNQGATAPPTQGEHNRPGGNPDEKHIESIPATASANGTDASGGFIFALRSATAGSTAVEASVDANDNDVNDSETTGTATVNWLSTTPSPTGGSPTGSASASRSASATASRSASGSTSPSATPASRTITLEASRNTARFGKKVVLSGLVDSSNTSCESGQSVRIQRALIGEDFADFATATTGSDGSYTHEFRPEESATYRAIVAATSSCQEATSTEEIVRVRVRVGLRASDRKVRKGTKVRLTATVAPCGNHEATEVALLRSFGNRYKELKRKGLNANCKASFKVRMKRTSAFKVRWPSQDDNHEAGTSPERFVQVRGRG